MQRVGRSGTVTIAKPPKVDRHISLSPEVDAVLSALAEEDAAADALGAEPNRSATVARLALAERARRASAGMVTEERGQAGWSRRAAPKGGPGPRKAGTR